LKREYAGKLRQNVFEETTPHEYMFFRGVKLLPDAPGQDNMIILLRKSLPGSESSLKVFELRRFGKNIKDKNVKPESLFEKPYCRMYNCQPLTVFDQKHNRICLMDEIGHRIWEDINKNCSYLLPKELKQGIISPQQHLTRRSFVKLSRESEVRCGEGIFVLSANEYATIDWTLRERQLIKPFHFAREIQSHSYECKTRFFLIYTSSEHAHEIKDKPDLYPNIRSPITY